jgi:DNA-binding MarR family transcriptional regulator
MKYEKEIAEIRDLFLSILNKYRMFEKIPHHYGTGEILYPAEVVMIETLGAYPGINVTELAKKHGVTKGAISQTIKKLEKKELVKKTKSASNSKEVLLSLTMKGEIAYHQHQLFHLQAASELFDEIDQWTPEQMEFLKRAFATFDRMFDSAMEMVNVED